MTATEPDVRDLLRQIREAIHGAQMLTGVQFRERLGLCRTAFHTRRAMGKIGPQPVTTLGHPKWHAAEVEAWMRTRDAAGELYYAARWPAVWRNLQRGGWSVTQIQVNNLVDAIRSGLVSSCVPTQDFASACNVADAIVYVSLSMDKIAKSIDNLADAIRESKN